MDENPVSTLEQKKDRRGLLALIGAGGAAAVAALLSRSNGVEAHGTIHHDSNDSTPAIHGNNSSTGAGILGTGTSGYAVYGETWSGDGIRGRRVATSGPGAGVQGFSGVAQTAAPDRVGGRFVGMDSGVRGETSGGGTGVQGNSSSGKGVEGSTSSGYGVYGWSNSGYALFGESSIGDGLRAGSNSGTGLRAGSNSGDGLRARRSSSSSTGAGVQGFSGVSETDAPDRVGGRFVGMDTGVRGEGSTTGVTGKGTGAGAVGLYGNAGSGSVGVRAEATGTKAALHVKGRSRFKQSGKTTVSAGAYSKVAPLTFTLAPGSLVVATLQGNAGSGVAVRTAAKYGSNKIRITLTKAATQSATIAYFIFTP